MTSAIDVTAHLGGGEQNQDGCRKTLFRNRRSRSAADVPDNPVPLQLRQRWRGLDCPKVYSRPPPDRACGKKTTRRRRIGIGGRPARAIMTDWTETTAAQFREYDDSRRCARQVLASGGQ